MTSSAICSIEQGPVGFAERSAGQHLLDRLPGNLQLAGDIGLR